MWQWYTEWIFVGSCVNVFLVLLTNVCVSLCLEPGGVGKVYDSNLTVELCFKTILP